MTTGPHENSPHFNPGERNRLDKKGLLLENTDFSLPDIAQSNLEIQLYDKVIEIIDATNKKIGNIIEATNNAYQAQEFKINSQNQELLALGEEFADQKDELTSLRDELSKKLTSLEEKHQVFKEDLGYIQTDIRDLLGSNTSDFKEELRNLEKKNIELIKEASQKSLDLFKDCTAKINRIEDQVHKQNRTLLHPFERLHPGFQQSLIDNSPVGAATLRNQNPNSRNVGKIDPNSPDFIPQLAHFQKTMKSKFQVLSYFAIGSGIVNIMLLFKFLGLF